MSSSLHILVLAAGQGKRMHSSLPKVLHPVLFRPMLHHVLDLAAALSPKTTTVVVGHGEAEVRESCAAYPEVRFVRQAEQKGTGHAVQQAVPLLQKETGKLMVLCGDVVLLQPSTLEPLLAESGSANILTAVLPIPGSYGRIVRASNGGVRAIREQVDCTPEEKALCEVNSGVYTFDLSALLPALASLGNHNKQGEYYLTDVIEILVKEGKRVEAVKMADFREMIGINDRIAQAEVEKILRDRVNSKLLASGVSLQDPQTTWIDTLCEIAPDVRIESGCQIVASQISTGSWVEAGSRLTNCQIGKGTRIKQGSYLENSVVGDHCAVGPYAHLRPGSHLHEGVKIGNFVEIKKSTLGAGSKASHLAYIGDATVGADVNLGCGFITCNFDGGPRKHQTVIEDGVFIGSDSQTVAPVRIGKGSYVASGSTVTEDVPADSLVITRGRQTTKPGYAKKYKKE